MIAIFAIGIWAVVINNTSNEKFPVKILEDQQKACVAFIRLISTLGVLSHCAIWKYIYQNRMEGVIIWLVILPISRISIYFSVLVGCFLFIQDSITFYHISWELMCFLQLVINVKDGQTMKIKKNEHEGIILSPSPSLSPA